MNSDSRKVIRCATLNLDFVRARFAETGVQDLLVLGRARYLVTDFKNAAGRFLRRSFLRSTDVRILNLWRFWKRQCEATHTVFRLRGPSVLRAQPVGLGIVL